MSELKAGFCRMDITPPLGIHLAGYYTVREADGMLDPLSVSGLAISDGERTAVVLVCDLLGLYGEIAGETQRFVAEKLALPQQAVFLCCTHTHTGPSTGGGRDSGIRSYDEWLMQRLADTGKMAMDDLTPVTGFSAAEGEAPGVTFVRRFLMKDGHYQTWAKSADPNIERPACAADETMRLVKIARENAPELLLVNFQVHPDNVGGCKISADFPAVLRNEVEAAVPGARCIFFQGAEGQLINTDYIHGIVPKSRDKAALCGHRLAQAALRLYPALSPIEGTDVRFGSASVTVPTKRDPARVPEALRLIALHEAGRDAEIEPRYDSLPLVAEAYKLRNLDRDDQNEITLTESFVTFGPLALAGFPGEPFCEIGVDTRAGSPYPVTFACALTNGAEGYYPTAEAYKQGGYEPRNSPLRDGAAELLAQTAVQALKKIHSA